MIEYLAVLVIGYVIGRIHTYFKIARILRDMAEAVGFDIEKELQKNKKKDSGADPGFHKLRVESHGDVLYLFERETDNFICQGSSVQELAKLAKDYKNIGLAAVIHGDKVFAFKDGDSQEFTG